MDEDDYILAEVEAALHCFAVLCKKLLENDR